MSKPSRCRPTGRLLSRPVAILLAAGVLVATASAQAAPASAGLHAATIDGARIAYRDINPSAAGTPLVLITGYGATMAEWDPAFIQRLADHRRVIMFDNRGVGNSTGPVAGLTIREMADDAAGLIRVLKLHRVDVLGWSMGGFIAQELTLDRPTLVRRLILASTDPGSPHSVPGTARVIDLLTNPKSTPTQLLPILFPASAQTAATAWLTAVATQPGITGADFAVPAATLAAQKTATTTDWLRAGEGTYTRLPRLIAPTLVSYGTEDVIVPPVNARLLLTRIPHVVGLRISDAGHAFLFQDPTTIAADFVRFLDSAKAL
ncbi:MAG: alpha/beta fold hydrolase [Solirubrobacteraceae bacterium]